VVTLTDSVDPAIGLIEHRFGNGNGPEGLAYLRSHAYFNQLVPADECLRSFVTYELDPAGAGPVGGAGRALGKLVGPHDEVSVPLRQAVAATVTASYLALLMTEDPPGSSWVPGRDAESLWTFWMSHLSPAAMPAFAIPERFADSVRREGGAHLESEIKRLGLWPGFFQRKPLVQRCSEISRFGLLLRAGQTTVCSDAEFARSQPVRA
jgi:hypothetical protein